jgi:hypothetical protein
LRGIVKPGTKNPHNTLAPRDLMSELANKPNLILSQAHIRWKFHKISHQ